MFDAIRSLYDSARACVRINGLKTNWFDVNIGLRQGCNLSPVLFNLFVNDFAVSVKALGKGKDLQFMLDSLNSWWHSNHMSVNRINRPT